MLAPTAVKIPARHAAMPDDQLMRAFTGGDTLAFDTLYARHESAVLRFVQRMLGTRLAGEVKDVFHETWVRIVTVRAHFSSQDAAWGVWAYTIAHNLAMDRLQVAGRDARFSARDTDEDGDAHEPLPPARALGAKPIDPSIQDIEFWRSAGRHMLACLNELPDTQRAAFLLHHEDGFTVEKIAETLDVGLDTVRNRLLHGRLKLQAAMERRLAEQEDAA
ncbi:MAG: polymerase subunit sigma-24 [Variovorax sp.]|nr:polymerase subunit sigma-24 [Variovorax sp.]